MQKNSVDYKYAESLAQILNNSEIIQVEQELNILIEVFKKDSKLLDLFLSPILSIEKKKDLCRDILANKLSDKTNNFILTLLRLRRTKHLFSIFDIFKDIVDIRLNRVRVKVFLPNQIKQDENLLIQENVLKFIKNNASNLKLDISREIDFIFLFVYVQDLLGGAKIFIGDYCLDTSIESYLKTWKYRVMKNKLEVSKVFI